MQFHLYQELISGELLTKITWKVMWNGQIQWQIPLITALRRQGQGSSLWVWGQFDLYSKIQASSSIYIVIPHLKKAKYKNVQNGIDIVSIKCSLENLCLSRIVCAYNPRTHETEAEWSGVKTLDHKKQAPVQ